MIKLFLSGAGANTAAYASLLAMRAGAYDLAQTIDFVMYVFVIVFAFYAVKQVNKEF